ncbi:hypothetical protein [Streptomyces sp. NPDC127033]|uniref:hypothetical protein n=1 Tax=Streptomyces sp. NPDC127033 TaxID=3347110 RepID=UPI003650E749
MYASRTQDNRQAGERDVARPVSGTGPADRMRALQNQAGNRNTSRAVADGQLRPAAPAGAVSVQRMQIQRAPGGRRMHPGDIGQRFELELDGRPEIGTYVRASSNGREEIFRVRGEEVRVYPHEIRGIRATHGGMHPPGRRRPPEENLEGRDTLLMSEGDLSGARGIMRRDPGRARSMAVTTFDARPVSYGQAPGNLDDMHRTGTPVLPDFDISDPARSADRIGNLAPNANLHMQMPSVPRGTSGYSTQRLVRDANRLPERAGRPDYSTSVTTPHPGNYPHPATHNQRYGMQNRRGVPQGREIYDEGPDEMYREEDGYDHRETTQDRHAGSSSRRRTYRIRSQNPDDYDDGSGGRRSRSPR